MRRPARARAVSVAVVAALGSAGLAAPASGAALATPAAAPGRAAALASAGTPLPGVAPRVVVDHLVARHGAPTPYRVELPYPQLSGALTTGERELDAAMRAEASRAAARFEREVLANRPFPGGPGGSGATSTLGGVVTTDLVSASVVALTVDADGYFADAAHGFTTVTTFDFATATGRTFALASLFRPGSPWLEALSRASRSVLRRTLGPLTVPEMLDPGTTPRASNFSAFALTPWGLRLTFQDYQVAPYAAGTPTVTLPYASLDAVARPGGAMAGVAADPPRRMPLLPATTPPVVDECSAPVHYAGYVVPEPSLCRDGSLNADAWDAFANAGLRVLGLPPGATLAQVRGAMCADDATRYSSSATLELHAEALSAAYHGWRFGAAPRTGFPGYCA